jgi:CTP:molybdopterin cytidylyltransferase MocA
VSARVACAILAAGASRRLGRPKQLVLHRGRPLVRLAAECAWQARAVECAVVIGAHADAVRAALGGLPVEPVYNPDWNEGVASSIRMAADWARAKGSDALLIALCDQPRLTPEHLDRLIGEYEQSGLPVASRYALKNAVPALFPRSLFDALGCLRGDAGASVLLNGSSAVAAVAWADGEFDVDTTQDLPCFGQGNLINAGPAKPSRFTTTPQIYSRISRRRSFRARRLDRLE